jgi:hypothetical protein
MGTVSNRSALLEYSRDRLGKTERLILETPTQVYPDALTKGEVAVKPTTKPTVAASTAPWAGLGRWNWSRAAARSRPETTCLMQGEGTSAGLRHQFHAIAFEENLPLR